MLPLVLHGICSVVEVDGEWGKTTLRFLEERLEPLTTLVNLCFT